MIRSLVSIFIILSFNIDLDGQIDTSYFDSPIKHDIVLAGSFGELRTTHFHAGIDIKPVDSKGGDSLFVAAEGYISRIKIQTGGYGRVLYVDHPNGYTTVYAHMEVFADSIEQYIQELQYASRSYEVDIYPQPDKIQLARGQFIGLLGNTGRSYGAHLHFEIRDTQSETPINPALFGLYPQDHRAPDLVSVSIHGMTPDYQEIYKRNYPLQPITKHKYTISSGSIAVPAWRVGVLAQGWDRMDGASNKNGIYRMTMSVDDTLRYAVTMDSIGWEETGYIKSHVDYSDRQLHNRTAVRCYQLPGNSLNIYDSTGTDGIFPIYTSKKRRVVIEASDIVGNRTFIDFDITRDANIKQVDNSFEKLLTYDQAHTFTLGACRFHFPEHTLDRNLYMRYRYEKEVYHIHEHTTPIFQDVDLAIKIAAIDSSLVQHLCLVYTDDDKLYTFGGSIVGDSLVTQIDKLGPYRLHIDTIPPTIEAIATDPVYSTSEVLKMRVTDDLRSAGNAKELKIDVYIDDVWVIAPYKILDRTLEIPLHHLQIGEHHIRIVAVDDRGNKVDYHQKVTIR